MKARFSLTAILAALAILAPTLSGFSQVSKPDPKIAAKIRQAKPSFARGSAVTAGTTSATIELESEPVVQWQRSRAGTRRGAKMVLDSPDAIGYEAGIEAEQQDFISRALLLSPNMRVVTRLSKLANAVSVEAPAAEIARLSTLPNVKRIEMNKPCRITTDTSVPLIGAPQLWDRLGGSEQAGDGIKIAILDSGIDITNPLFSDAGFTAPAGFPRGSVDFTNNKVIVAKAFLSTAGATPRDQNGHGTNVAGIAAGNADTSSPLGTLSGVAPRAFLGNYRVADAEGGGRSDFIARAIEEAVSDGFDVANLSLGSEADAELGLMDRAVESAVAAGIVVVVSAGNDGDFGEKTVTSPGVAPSAITVGATTTSHFVIAPSLSVTGPAPVPRPIEDIEAVVGNGFSNPIEGIFSSTAYVDVQTLDGGRRACEPLPAGSLAGKVALVERGGENCTFVAKVNNAAIAGAVGVIVFNKPLSEGEDGGDGLINMEVTGTTIPSVFIARTDGLNLRAWFTAHPDAAVRLKPVGALDFPSDIHVPFSSRGPTLFETLKPDLVAPGFSIYSGAIPQFNPLGVSDPSGFSNVSGTSQAAPHVAGAAALLQQLHPDWTPAQIKSALMTSADDLVFSVEDGKEFAHLLDMGAGRVDLEAAGQVTATFAPASLSFGIRKLKKFDVTVPLDLNITSVTEGRNTFSISIHQIDPGDGVTVRSSASSVSLDQGQSQTVTVTVDAIRGSQRRDYTGFVVVEGPQGQVLQIPYWVRFVKRKG